MALPAFKKDYKYTYRDYCSWPDEERWEIIEGVPVAMSPAPGRSHQEVSGNIYFQLRKALLEKLSESGPCKIFAAPFDVRLPESDEADDHVTTVVQPDISIICDPSRLDDRGCRGAPDLIMEILSPSTAAQDLGTKKELYEKHGVREYWIVQPREKIVIVYKQIQTETENRKSPRFDKGSVYTENDSVSLSIFADVVIPLNEVFSD